MLHFINSKRVLKVMLFLCAAGLVAALLVRPTASVKAADHRDAPTVDGLPEGDITDVFTLIIPETEPRSSWR